MKLNPTSLGASVLLTVLVAFGPLSTDMYLPALPGMAAAFATTVGQVQLTLSVFLGGFGVAQLIMGPLTDRFGRRPVLLGAIMLYFASGVACALATSIDGLIMFRFLQGTAACAGPVVARAIVRDIYSPADSGRVLAYMAAAMAIAPLLAPFVGGELTVRFGWRANFVMMAAIGAVLVLIVAMMLEETNRHRNPEATRLDKLVGNYMALARSREFLGCLLTNGFVFAGLFAYISGAPFVFIDVLGVAPRQFGFYFGVGVLVFIIGSTACGRLSRHMDGQRLMGAGAVIAGVSGLIMAALAFTTPASAAAVLVPMSAFGIGVGLVMPMAMAGAIGPFPHMAGSAAALMGCAQMALGALSGFIVGQVHDGTTRPMTTVIAVAGVATLLSYLFMRPRA